MLSVLENNKITNKKNKKKMSNVKNKNERRLEIYVVHGDEKQSSGDGLSPRGIQDTQKLSEKIKLYLNPKDVVQVLTSNLSRSRETAEIIALKLLKQKNYSVSSELNEYENIQVVQNVVDGIEDSIILVSQKPVINNYLKSIGCKGSSLGCGQGIMKKNDIFTRI